MLTLLTPFAVAGTEEAAEPTLRQKLHAKIMESVPPPPPPKPSTDQAAPASAPPVILKAVIVSDSKLIQAVTESIDREAQNRRDQQFKPLDGGTLYSFGLVQIGSWYAPGEGWTFLRLNNAPTRRQLDAADARLRDLQELLRIGESTPSRSAPPGTRSAPPPRPNSQR